MKEENTQRKYFIIGAIVVLVVGILLFFLSCDRNRYTIRFEVDGKVLSSSNLKKGETVEIPKEPTKDGYTFAGWYVNGEKFDFNQPINENAEIEARWEVNTYTVRFISGIGDATEEKVEYQSTLTENKPTKKGYEFLGWYLGEELYDFSTPVTSDMTLVAKWKTVEENETIYLVEHYLMNRNQTYENVPFEVQVFMGKPNSTVTPKTLNYKGYKSPKSISTKVKEDGSAVIQYYYEIETYTLNVLGDKGFEEVYGSGNYYYDDLVSIRYVLKPGYHFVNASETLDDLVYTMKDKNTTIHLSSAPDENTSYQVEHYQMDVDGNYPNEPTEVEEFTGTTDSFVTPKVNSYIGFKSPSVETIKISGDGSTVLKYYYSRNKYAVKANLGKGIQEVAGTGEYYYRSTVTLKAIVKEGYTFDSWNIGDKEETIRVEVPAASLEVLAQAKVNQYSIVYEGNNEMSNRENYTIEDTFTLKVPKKNGYDFKDWTIKNLTTSEEISSKDGNIKNMYGDLVITANYTPRKDTPYQIEHYQMDIHGEYHECFETTKGVGTTESVATFTPKTYVGFEYDEEETKKQSDVLIDGNGNSVVKVYYKRKKYTLELKAFNGIEKVNITSPTEFYYQEPVYLSAEVKIGYTFKSWLFNQKEISSNADYYYTMPNEDVILEAIATPNHYTIRYHGNNGNDLDIVEENYVTDISKPILKNSFTYKFHTFVGWSTNSNALSTDSSILKDNTEILNFIPEGTADLYAIWEYDKNIVHFVVDGVDYETYNNQVYGQLIEEPTSPTKPGYKFLGWYDDQDKQWNFENDTMPDNALELHAKWEANTDTPYLVEVCKEDLNGQFTTDCTVSTQYGTTDTIAEPITETFTGFTLKSVNEEQLTIRPDGKSKVKVLYSRNKHQVNVTPDIGIQEVIGYGEYYYGAPVTVSVTIKAGYGDVIWDSGTQNQNGLNYVIDQMPDTDINLSVSTTAQNVSYKVKHYFMNVEGTYDGVEPEVDNVIGTTDTETDTASSIKTREGFISPTKVLNENINGDGSTEIEYYYERKKVKFTILNGNGTSTSDYFYGSTVHVTVDGKIGYTFNKWSNDETREEFDYLIPATDTSLTAMYTPNKYKIKFHMNDGLTDQISESNEFTYDEHGTLVEPAFEKNITVNKHNVYPNEYMDEKYKSYRQEDTATVVKDKILGWSTEPTGTVLYKNGADIYNLSEGSDIDLYAVWYNAVDFTSESPSLDLVFGGWSSTPSKDNIVTLQDGKYTLKADKGVVNANAIWYIVPLVESVSFNLYNDKDGTSPLEVNSYVKGDHAFYMKLPVGKFIDLRSLGVSFNTNISFKNASKKDSNYMEINASSNNSLSLSGYQIKEKTIDDGKTWTSTETVQKLYIMETNAFFNNAVGSQNIAVAEGIAQTKDNVLSSQWISSRASINGNVFLFFAPKNTELIGSVRFINAATNEEVFNLKNTVYKGNLTPNIGSVNQSGYDFKGWYTDSTFGTEYSFDKPIYDNVTVYGKFEKKPADTNWYQPDQSTFSICKLEELYGLAELAKNNDFTGKNINLNCNIEFANGDYWEPISKFNGHFNGNNFMIKNMNINVSSGNAGLFSELGTNARVENLRFENAILNSTAAKDFSAGILAGISNAGTIIDKVSVNNFSINATQNVGGLIGTAKGSTLSNISISNSKADGIFSPNGDVGGIVGLGSGTLTINHSIVKDVKVSSSVSATKKDTGGIMGDIVSGTLKMNHVVFIGSIIADGNDIFGMFGNPGGIVGEISSSVVKADSDESTWLYDSETVDRAYEISSGSSIFQTFKKQTGNGHSKEELKKKSTYSGWSEEIWHFDSNDSDYPTLKWIWKIDHPE